MADKRVWHEQVLVDSSGPADAADAEAPVAGEAAREPPPSKPPAAKDGLVQPLHSRILWSQP